MEKGMTRREFMVAAAAASALPAWAQDGKFIWGALLHLGGNMWDDFQDDPDGWAKSAEEETTRPNPMGPSGKRISRYRSYLRCDDAVWRRTADAARDAGCNLLFVDLGEGVAYPSHPELAVPGTWSVEKLRKELSRLRTMGLEPIPKLNFSATHDAWLKDYHRMLSTPKYYSVVSDLIREVCEIFDHPRFFHIGYDEEHAGDQHNHFHVTARQGDLWWHDLNYTIGEVERNGAQAAMWSDAVWFDRRTFLRRMSKGVVQMNWYYRADFSEKALAWKPEFEKTREGWPEKIHGAAAFLVLQEAGFRQLPCLSNYFEDGATDAVVRFCRERMDPSLLLGICAAPWAYSVADSEGVKGEAHTLRGLRQFGDAKRKYYGG